MTIRLLSYLIILVLLGTNYTLSSSLTDRIENRLANNLLPIVNDVAFRDRPEINNLQGGFCGQLNYRRLFNSELPGSILRPQYITSRLHIAQLLSDGQFGLLREQYPSWPLICDLATVEHISFSKGVIELSNIETINLLLPWFINCNEAHEIIFLAIMSFNKFSKAIDQKFPSESTFFQIHFPDRIWTLASTECVTAENSRHTIKVQRR
jgi:hypothetical protein